MWTQGEARGKAQEKTRVALNLLKTGALSVEQISEVTELPLEAVEQIKVDNLKLFQ